MEVRTVLFDAGNTLIELDYRALSDLLHEGGVIASPGEIREASGRVRPLIDSWLADSDRSKESVDSRARMISLVLTNLGVTDSDRIERVSAEVAAALSDLWTVPMEGAHDVLEVLRNRGLGIGVVSNSDGRVERFFRGCGLLERVDTIVDSGIEGVEKPDPVLFRTALERMNARADSAVHVGDMPSVDVDGARAAGVSPILMDPFGVFEDIPVPRIRSLSQLPPLLDTF